MCVYREVSPASQIRAEIRLKSSGYSFWAKYQEAIEAIDLQELLNEYWSTKHEAFSVLSSLLSPPSLRRSDQKDRDYCDWEL